MAKLKPDYIEWVIKLNSTQAQDEYHKLEKANRELQKETNASRKAMTELEKQGKKGSQEWKNLKSSIEQNNRVMGQNRQKMQELSKQFDLSSMTVNELRKQLKDLTREFNNTSKASDPKRYKELQDQIQRTKEALNQATGSAKNLQGGFTGLTKMKGIIVGFFAGIGSAISMHIIGSFRNAFKDLQNFELENSRLAAQLGTTSQGIKELTDSALKWESATTYSATAVTQLQQELVKLGYSKTDVLEMSESVIMFAKIAGVDLPEAASLAGSTLKIFGKDASEVKDVMAILSAASNTAGLDFGTLQSALSTLGPVASQTGFSLEDTVAILGMLQRSGLDASAAANATRNMLLKMSDPAGKLAVALGGPVRTAEELEAGLKRLSASGVDLGEALELTDRRTAQYLETMIQSGTAITDMKTAIDGAKGSFEETYKMLDNNVAGSLASLSSATDSLIKQIASGTNGPLKSLIDMLVSLVNGLKAAVQWIQENSRWVKTIVAGIAAWKVSQLALNKVQTLWNSIVKISGAQVKGLALSEQMEAVAKGLYTKATNAATAATKSFSAALKSIPWTAVIGLITSAISYFTIFKDKTDDATNSLDDMSEAEREAKTVAEEHKRKREELNVSIETQKKKYMDLHSIAADVTRSEEERLAAINALNAAIPGYNGSIDRTTGALRANTTALHENIAAMETRMRLAFYKDEYEQYIREEEKAKLQRKKVEKGLIDFYNENPRNAFSDVTFTVDGDTKIKTTPSMTGEAREQFRNRFYEAMMAEKEAISKRKEFLEIMKAEGYTEGQVLGAGDVTIPEAPKLDVGSGKGGGGSKRSVSTGSVSTTPRVDRLKEATKEAELKHKQELANIEKEKEDLSDADYSIKKAEELIRYCVDLQIALDDLKSKTKSTETDLLTKISEREMQIESDFIKAEQAINAANAAKAEKAHSDRLDSLQAFYDEQEKVISENVQKSEITQEAADIFLMAQQKKLHEDQLKELQSFYKEVEASEYIGEEARKERLSALKNEIRNTQKEILNDTGAFMEKFREMTSEPNSIAGVKAAYDSQKIGIIQSYEEMKKLVQKDSAEYVALEEAKNRKLLLLDYQYQDQLYALQENVGLSWANEYDRELMHLKEMHAQGIISEKEYQRKRFELGVENAKKYFDFYAGLSGSMFQAIQDAEIAASDAKYDVLIRQAENNGEETAQLEQEKENKKLEIQKKYADVNFAIKVSTIVADTAVAIMKAFADLGPIGGAVAAALMSATGAAQVIMANAEREKIKNLQPKTAASGSSVANGAAAAGNIQRVLTGFSDGGYTGDGNRYEVAGLVHKGEYVVPKPIMENPRVVDAVGTIEAIRLNRMGKTAGFADGGFTSSAASGGSVAASSGYGALISEMRSLTREMQSSLKNIRAYLVFQDLEKARKTIENSRAPFTK